MSQWAPRSTSHMTCQVTWNLSNLGSCGELGSQTKRIPAYYSSLCSPSISMSNRKGGRDRCGVLTALVRPGAERTDWSSRKVTLVVVQVRVSNAVALATKFVANLQPTDQDQDQALRCICKYRKALEALVPPHPHFPSLTPCRN